MSYPRYRLGRHHKFSGPATNSVLVDTTSNWENLSVFEPSFSDITLHKCQPNDVLQVYLAGTWEDEPAQGDLTVVTVVNDVVVNYLPSGDNTPMACRGWRGRGGTFTDFGSWSPMYAIQVSDIHNDWDVTLRLRTLTDGPKTFAYDQSWSVVNLGPAQKAL